MTLRGMAMGAVKGRAATLQVEMVCLDELVPAEDRLRRIDAEVDLGLRARGGGAVLRRGRGRVVACRGEQADGHEGDALAPIADRARFACPRLESVGADQGFAAERVWAAMEDRGLEAFVAPRLTMLPADAEPKTDAQRAALAARERCKTPARSVVAQAADGRRGGRGR